MCVFPFITKAVASPILSPITKMDVSLFITKVGMSPILYWDTTTKTHCASSFFMQMRLNFVFLQLPLQGGADRWLRCQQSNLLSRFTHNEFSLELSPPSTSSLLPAPTRSTARSSRPRFGTLPARSSMYVHPVRFAYSFLCLISSERLEVVDLCLGLPTLPMLCLMPMPARDVCELQTVEDLNRWIALLAGADSHCHGLVPWWGWI
jgi:hypothetical protein